MSIKCPKCQFDNPSDSKFCKECGTQLIPTEEISPPTETLEAAKEELTTGSTFAGRYQIIEELGKGGMGKVYKAHDTKINEKIALKLIKPEVAADKKTIERFSNELKFARKIRHNNVCQMFDLNEEKGTHYITMEYVRGEDLKKLVRKMGQLSVGQVIPLAKQVCDGLAEAHRLGVVHRDLKPQNIMVDEEGNARIMDFGIARSIIGKGITGAGVMIGTPEYMSPEQAEVKEVDQRSDIYSLGVILYELVTGRVPFEGETPLGIAMKHKSEVPKDPRELNAQISEDLSGVILRCLEKDKENRYQSAGEVRSELVNIEKGIPTTEKVVPKRKPITSREITVTLGLKKLFIPALVVVAATIIGIIIWQLLPQKKPVLVPSGKSSLAVMYFENRSHEPDLDKILVDMLITNLSRSEEIEVVSNQRLFDILKQLGKEESEKIDKNMATEVANRAGVKTMMTGSIIKIGEKIRITSQLTNVQTGAIVGSEQVEGTRVEDVFDMVDQLTEKVSAQLEVSPESREQHFKIADVTTNSFESYRYYRKGLENIWRWNFSEAEENFEEAVKIDSTFAMAHLYLALAKGAYGMRIRYPFTDLTSIRKSIQTAKKYASKATNKEQLFIEMYDALANREFEKAVRLSSDFVKRFPKDKDSSVIHGYACMYTNQTVQAIETSERILEIFPTFAVAYNMLAYDFSRIQNYQKAISAVKEYIALQPDVFNTYDSAWEIYMMAGLYDEAIQACQEALKKNPNWRGFYIFEGYGLLFKGEQEKANEKIRQFGRHFPDWPEWEAYNMGLFFLHEKRYDEAIAEFQKAVKLLNSKQSVRGEMFTRFDLGKLLAELGQYSRAMDEFSAAEKLSSQIYDSSFNPLSILSYYLSGVIMVKKGDYAEAKAYVAKIEKEIKSKNYDDLLKDFYYLLLGESFVAQGKGQAALDVLQQASAITKYYSPRFRVLEAAALTSVKDWEKAINAYLRLYNLVEARKTSMGDRFYYFLERSKINYYIAQIYEKQDKNAKAIEYYQKALEQWKNADPGIAEVEDAKKRLVALK
jgi:serine/threonine protein kinase/Flp pilus assembly protein TadD